MSFWVHISAYNQDLRHSRASIVSMCGDEHSSLMVFFALEKIRSASEDMAGVENVNCHG